MATAAFKRVEMKFILSREQFEGLVPSVLARMQPDEHCGKNGYTIHNIYYDTPDSALIRTSLEKPGYKEKLRLRSYAAPVGADGEVFVELKKKTDGVVHKRRAVMTLREAERFLRSGRRPQPRGYLNEQVTDEIAYLLSRYALAPAVYIGYTRTAYFGRDDRDFRLTFDCGIRARRSALSLSQSPFGELLLPEGQYLMELKVSRSVPLWLSDELARLGIYKTSFSKYGTEYQGYFRRCAGQPRGVCACLQAVPLYPRLCADY